jgi:F-type H+-transporting ATPase subunit b
MFEDHEFWVATSFVLFLALMLYLRVPGKIGAALDNRAKRIGKELEEARAIRAEAEALMANYRDVRAQAEKDAAEIVGRAKADAETMAAEMRRQIETQMARRAQLAEDNIRRAEAQAIQEVRARAADLGAAAARDLIVKQLDAKRARALVDHGIAAIGGKFH